MRWGRSITRAPVLAVLALGAAGQAEAQLGYGPGPYAGRYVVAPGRPGVGYPGSFRVAGPAYGPQTTIALQPLYQAITSIPGWYGPHAGHPAHPRAPSHPKVPRDQLLGDDGKVLWPGVTPGDPAVAPARRAAEEGIRTVVQEAQKYGHASVRHVVEAKNTLTAFERLALKELWARRANSEADRLQTFIHELDKTLETMAVNY
jgi:hypothetical protein